MIPYSRMYSLILNSNNRADKTNTNENNCEYYFDWSVLQQGKYKLSYSISKVLTAPPTAFQNLIATKIPWGLWKASSYNSTLQIIVDDSGNGRNASCGAVNLVTSPIGNRATVGIPALSGLKLSNIVFPPGSIPSQKTGC